MACVTFLLESTAVTLSTNPQQLPDRAWFTGDVQYWLTKWLNVRPPQPWTWDPKTKEDGFGRTSCPTAQYVPVFQRQPSYLSPSKIKPQASTEGAERGLSWSSVTTGSLEMTSALLAPGEQVSISLLSQVRADLSRRRDEEGWKS